MMNTLRHDKNQSSSCIVCQKPVRFICPCLRRHFCSLQCQNHDWNEGEHYANCDYEDSTQIADSHGPIGNRFKSSCNPITDQRMLNNSCSNREMHSSLANGCVRNRVEAYKWPKGGTTKTCSCTTNAAPPGVNNVYGIYGQIVLHASRGMAGSREVREVPQNNSKNPSYEQCCVDYRYGERPRQGNSPRKMLSPSRPQADVRGENFANSLPPGYGKVVDRLPTGYESESHTLPDSLPPGYERNSGWGSSNNDQSQTPSECEMHYSDSVVQSAQSESHSPSGTQKPRACTWKGCKKTFLRSDHYNRHLNTHTGYKPYHCTWQGCGKSFSQASNLSRHIKTHTNERPYACAWEGCDKRFSEGSNLARHYRLHSGQRPYPCMWKGCNKAFADRSYRTAHEKTHSRSEVFMCTIQGCNRTYSTKSYLRRHIKSHSSELSSLPAQ
ncbi:hypothetical protein SARC_05082 [Sphaeroforma arctica JP610]|uniref:Uncharacterized protein n=1 Tax=Sphaeroforma arctica JP610 TaxID=667725 RepID=A0A0L0G0L1_9EUKA|nr:hypothetical protein SARC_05082 [Sphaeroforma arctica JP610]KNC82642.1 hypothetical protein SARC_05082 [Sphaeroforma arctica JP610]|eukprot:XP_014156544.1 hypothetical protein SARC_05082 [Sphaeroforma arctica JP610]